MQEWAAQLTALQQIDVNLAKLQGQVAQIPERMKHAEALFAEEAAAFRAAKEAAQNAQKTQMRLEAEAGGLVAKRRSFQQKTATIKRNDEYQAAMEQLRQFEAELKRLDDEQLVWMERAEAAQGTLAQKAKALALAEKRAAEVRGDLKQFEENCRRQIAELEARRPEAAAAVPEALLRLYTRLRANRNYRADQPCVVPLLGGACGRCHTVQPPQTRQQVVRGEQVACESCGALLYQE